MIVNISNVKKCSPFINKSKNKHFKILRKLLLEASTICLAEAYNAKI